ncbi:MAG: PRC-barrel domain-containing protein [Oligoflexia bacterium]|nr:PRC-barrel domain-containing protein [Oligoflexia bacterium]
MLEKIKKIKGYKLNALDGEIGSVKEFYFDDHYWTIRYLVAETGSWLTGKQVLISPYALININNFEKSISINLSKKQIENSPSLNSDIPVSKQFEEEYYNYYGWPTYLNGPYMWGSHHQIIRDHKKWEKSTSTKKAFDHNLRSTYEVSGYRIQATDEEIGHVDDFVIDDETWTIRYLIIATNNWWPGKTVMISPQWIKRVSWSESKVYVNLSAISIKNSPEYTEESLIDRDYETKLYLHYKHQGYWGQESSNSSHCNL